MIGGVICPPAEAAASTPPAKWPGIAQPFHVGDGQRAGRDGIGDRGARDGAEEGRGYDRHLGGTAGVAPGQNAGIVDEKLPQPGPLGNHAEKHEVKDDGRDHPEGDAEDAFLREIH